MTNIIEGIQQEVARLREDVLPVYEETPGGLFAAALMRNAIKQAEKAVAQGGTIAMIQCYQELKDYTL